MISRFLTVLLSIGLFGITLSIQAQSFIGSQIDNRAGIQSVIFNPANVAGSRMGLDINIASGSALVGSDYLNLNFGDLKKFKDGFYLQTDASTTPKEHNNFFGNIDLLGPSFQMNIGKSGRNSVALTTRLRAFFNLHNIGGDLYKISTSSQVNESFNLDMENVSGIIHAWGEIGGTFGRILLENNNHVLKGGVTLKYLFGAGGIYGSSNTLGAKFEAGVRALTTSGNMNFGYTAGFDSENTNFSDITSGFGADIGVVYEFRQNGTNSTSNSPYKLKVGASVTDMGNINYETSPRFLYNMNATINAIEFENKNLEQVLEDNFSSIETMDKVKLSLPTAVQLFADYSINNKFYVSAHGAVALLKNGEIPVSKIINTLTITPRFEAKWLSIYSPVSFREYNSNISWGVGLRAGPVIVGSGSILTNLMSKTTSSTDLYLGVKVPLYRKNY